MSRFYGSIQGSKGQATRQGGKESGIRGHIRGWNVGGEVNCYVNDDGEDEVAFFLTSGSSGEGKTFCLGRFRRKDLDKKMKR